MHTCTQTHTWDNMACCQQMSLLGYVANATQLPRDAWLNEQCTRPVSLKMSLHITQHDTTRDREVEKEIKKDKKTKLTDLFYQILKCVLKCLERYCKEKISQGKERDKESERFF